MAIFSSGSDKNALPTAPAAPSAPKSSRPSAASVAAAVHGGRSADALADYLFAQARESLQALHQHGYLSARDYQTIKAVLDGSKLTYPDPPASSRTRAAGREGDKEEDEEDIGKVNSWLRSTLEETSLIPNLVQSALTSAAPFLSGTQVDAIMEIVEESQGTLAKAVTNPSTQQVAKHGAIAASKGAARGAKTGWQASSRSVSGAVEKSKAQRQAKQRVKDEQQAVVCELATEREWARKRAVEHASGSHPTLAKTTEDKAHADRLAVLEARDTALAQQVAVQDAEDEKEKVASRRVPPLPWELQTLGPVSSASDQDALGGSFVSAQCIPLPEGDGAHSALTTTFSPWPGMVLSQSLVVSSGTKSDVRLAQQSQEGYQVNTQEWVESPTQTLSSPPPTSAPRSGSSASLYQGPPPPPTPGAALAPALGLKTATPHQEPMLPSTPPPLPCTQPPPRPPKTAPTSYRTAPPPATSRSLPPYSSHPPSGTYLHSSTPAAAPKVQPRASPHSPTGPGSRPPPPRPSGAVDETAPPPFGTVVDTTSSKRKGGWSRLLN